MNIFIFENNQRYWIKEDSFVIPRIGETLNIIAFTSKLKIHKTWWSKITSFSINSIFESIPHKINGKIKDIQYNYAKYGSLHSSLGGEILIILDNPTIS